MAVFSHYAQYYNLLYRDKDYGAEVDYVYKLIQTFAPGAGSVLDIGCGTGRHDELLAQKGLQITGIDLSATMIGLAQEFAVPGKLTFEVANAATFRAGRRFDVVLSLFHVVNYQTTNQLLEGFFETARVHLPVGGLFLFDAWYGPAVLSDRPVKRSKIIESNELKVSRHTTPHLSVNSNTVLVHFDVRVEEKITGNEHNLSEDHLMRYLFYPEVSSLAEKFGFEIVKFNKWLTDAVPDESSWYVVWCLVKK